MRILWWSNYLLQPTGYGTCARKLLPQLQETTDHEFVHLAASGLENTRPSFVNDVKVYGKSSQGGNLAVADVPVVCNREDIDLIFAHFDLWALAGDIQHLAEMNKVPPIIAYCPIDHDPAAPAWQQVWDATAYNIPYVEFGERMMAEAGVPEDKILDPIYHGVDRRSFKRRDVSKADALGVPDDTFVVGMVKNNQGTRSGYDTALAGFRQFLDLMDAEGDAKLYLHCSIHGSNAPDIQTWVNRYDLGEHVIMPSGREVRWGVDESVLNQRYNAMDVLMNPVRGEGFGLPMLEAMATGTPVIAGGFSCYDEETRAVTPDGIKDYTDIEGGDKVFTLNPETGEIEVKPVEEMHIYEHNGEMVHYESSRVDLNVTPNHRMLFGSRLDGPGEAVVDAYNTAMEMRTDGAGPTEIAEATGTPKGTVENWLYKGADPTQTGKRVHREGLMYEQAERTLDRESLNIPLAGEWGGVSGIPSLDVELATNANELVDEPAPPDVMRVLGWYISEGSLDRDKTEDYNVVRISNGEYVDEIHKAFDALGIPSLDVPNGSIKTIKAHSKELAALCETAGVGAKNKHIPKWAKEQPPEALRALLDALLKGDGASHHRTYYTVSKRLAEDVAEVAIKLGYSPTIGNDEPQDGSTFPDGHFVPVDNMSTKYRVGISDSYTSGYVNPDDHATVEEYDGAVWDPTVKDNHNLLVERNGKFAFSGNSMPELVGLDEGEVKAESLNEPVVDAPRGWIVPTWNKEMTVGKQSYRRDYNPQHLATAIAEAYQDEEARGEKGTLARAWADQHSWEEKASELAQVFNMAADTLFTNDEMWGDVQWQKIGEEGDELGGVGAFRR